MFEKVWIILGSRASFFLWLKTFIMKNCVDWNASIVDTSLLCINISALANQQWNCSLVYLLNLPWPSYWLSSETSLLFNNNKTIQINNISSALSTLANLYDLTITCWRPPPPSNTNYNKTSKKFILSESEYFQSYFDLLFKVRWK